jgi:hypothetical protein
MSWLVALWMASDSRPLISDNNMADVPFTPESATGSPVGLSTPSADHESQQPIGTWEHTQLPAHAVEPPNWEIKVISDYNVATI